MSQEDNRLVCLELQYSINSPMGELIAALELHKSYENNPLRLIGDFHNVVFDSDFRKIKRLVILNIPKKDLIAFLDIIKTEHKVCANNIAIITDIIKEEDKYFYHIKDDKKVRV